MFWANAEKVAQTALLSGDLMPIGTEPQLINQDGIDYFLHLKSENSAIKFAPKPKDFNPFLPYEEAMFVDIAGDDHVCLLNKFPVLSPHLLICSNDFIAQTAPLEASDFGAWLLGLDNDKALGFYNGGKTAGASQPHRHMQLIQTELPIESLIVNQQLPFQHQLFDYANTSLTGDKLYQDYIAGMNTLGLYHSTECKPYNILLTKRWMLIIPRTRNNVDGIFANGINYSGHFLLAHEDQIRWLQNYGVLRFLADCTK